MKPANSRILTINGDSSIIKFALFEALVTRWRASQWLQRLARAFGRYSK